MKNKHYITLCLLTLLAMAPMMVACDDDSSPSDTTCEARCENNTAINCHGSTEDRKTCENETPKCVYDKAQNSASCVADDTSTCSEKCSNDGRVAIHCNDDGSTSNEQCGNEMHCEIKGEKASCVAGEAKTCSATCRGSDKITCDKDKNEVVTPCLETERCIIDSKTKAPICTPKCKAECREEAGKSIAVTCPNGEDADAVETICEDQTPLCQTPPGAVPTCVAKKECIAGCDGNKAAINCDQQNNEVRTDCDSSKQEKCVEKTVGSETTYVCEAEQQTWEKPDNYVGDACQCEKDGCNEQGVPKPNTPNQDGITPPGCENVQKGEHPGSGIACMRSYDGEMAPKVHFPDGYCTLTATKCEGNATICNSATFGQYDTMKSCPKHTVMIDAVFDVKVLVVLTATLSTKLCAYACKQNSDCTREGYQCVKKTGTLLNGTNGELGFCYDENTLPSNTKKLTFTEF